MRVSDFLKKVGLVIVLSMVLVFAVSAEEQSVKDSEDPDVFTVFPTALGGFYGDIGGQGLSYQRWFNNWGVQTAVGIYYMDYYEDQYSFNASEKDTRDFFTYNVGIEAMYRVYSDSFKNWFDGCLYVFGGIMHTGKVSYTYTYSSVSDDEERETYPLVKKEGPFYTPVFNPGAGIGFEVVLFKHFSLPTEIGLFGSWEIGNIVPVDAGIRGQTGFRYRF